ncbi:hypothetical protein [Winogradskyella sp.]|uniref:hypothetical protein n=1 Tax=Winogradskyella sp. TaxID=1883156 RepID=UPI003F6AA648
MKDKLLTFIITLGLISFISCSVENDNNNNSNDPSDPLNGVWNLTRAVSGWGSYPEIEEGLVTFEFDTDNSTLTIINNLEENYPLPSNMGERNYEIVSFEDTNYIIIDGNELDFNGLLYGPKIEGDETNFYIDFGYLGRIDDARIVTDAAIWRSFER